MSEHEPQALDPQLRRSPGGVRFRILKGSPEGDEAAVLGLAIDRLATWEREHRIGPWVAAHRPRVGARAWPPGSRWAASLRATWGRDP